MPKSNNEKKREAEAAGKKPKLTKQAENAGKSATQKKVIMILLRHATALPLALL